jgi:hypothetical protein
LISRDKMTKSLLVALLTSFDCLSIIHVSHNRYPSCRRIIQNILFGGLSAALCVSLRPLR